MKRRKNFNLTNRLTPPRDKNAGTQPIPLGGAQYLYDFRSLSHLELKPSVEPVHPSVAVYVQRGVKLRHYPSLRVVAEEGEKRESAETRQHGEEYEKKASKPRQEYKRNWLLCARLSPALKLISLGHLLELACPLHRP